MESNRNFGTGLILLGFVIAVVAMVIIGSGFLTETPDQQKTGRMDHGENDTAGRTITPGISTIPVTQHNVTMPTLSAAVASFIAIDPVGNKNIGDLIIISGTTNLPARTPVYLREIDEISGEPVTKANKIVCPGMGEVNQWTFALDTSSSMKPGQYRYIVSTAKDDVNKSVQFTLQGAFKGPEKNLYYQSGSKTATIDGTGAPYIRVNPIGDRHKGDIFLIAGTTNLAEGTILSCTVWPVYYEDASKRPAVPSDDPCDGQWYAISAPSVVIKGAGDSNLWSCAVDTKIAQKTEMIFHVSTVNEDFTRKEVFGNSTFNLM